LQVGGSGFVAPPTEETHMSGTTEQSGATAIRSFHVDHPEEALEGLRWRIAAIRWPSRELVTDRLPSVQLETIQELARYSATDHDCRRRGAGLKALPRFKIEIHGVDIHRPGSPAGLAPVSASPRSRARSFGPAAAGSRSHISNLIYFNEVDKSGHFAAREAPELFATEVRAAFPSLR
jgi:hypothetical protein